MATLGWELYRSLLAVLRQGSLSAATRTLGLTQPTIGRHIAELERALGVALFTRSPRGLLPTEAARELEPHAQAMALAADALVRAASGEAGAARGTVRITASEIIGAEVLPKILASFRERHPAVTIELVLSNRPEIVKWHYSGRVATLKDRAETFKVQKEAAQGDLIELKEQATALQNQVVELNQQIKVNAQQQVLLPLSNSTVAKVSQLDTAIGELEDILRDGDSSTYPRTLLWHRSLNGDWYAHSFRPPMSFRIREQNETTFVLSMFLHGEVIFDQLEAGIIPAPMFLVCASLEEASSHAERDRESSEWARQSRSG
jgi:hypothetical protein